jgi:hypothetical protein
MSAGSTGIVWICSGRRVNPVTTLEENRPWWGARTSNPCGAASLSQVGSTPTLFRQHRPGPLASIAVAVEKAKRTGPRPPERDPCHTSPCQIVLFRSLTMEGEKRDDSNKHQNSWSDCVYSRPQFGVCTIRPRDGGPSSQHTWIVAGEWRQWLRRQWVHNAVRWRIRCTPYDRAFV